MSDIQEPDDQDAGRRVLVWNGRIEELGAEPPHTEATTKAEASPAATPPERQHESAPPATIAP
jgi:hypothetical protein